jgi:hypothetical protein
MLPRFTLQGGWAPSSVVSAVARREIPKTLRNLSRLATKWFEKHPVPADIANTLGKNFDKD